jgi:LAO/AO transport system kinase
MDRGRTGGSLAERRRQQERQWVRQLVRDQLEEMFLRHPAVAAQLDDLEAAVERGEVPAVTAARRLLDAFGAPAD